MRNLQELTPRITEASRLTHTGRRPEARALLGEMWVEATARSDRAEECVVAHFFAHAEEEPTAQLAWHARALDAARDAYAAGDERVAGFFPSLHANLAETSLRLGRLADARRAVADALSWTHLLLPDAYGETVRSLIARLVDELEARAREAAP